MNLTQYKYALHILFNNTAISKNIFVVNSILPKLLKLYYLSHKVCQHFLAQKARKSTSSFLVAFIKLGHLKCRCK